VLLSVLACACTRTTLLVPEKDKGTDGSGRDAAAMDASLRDAQSAEAEASAPVFTFDGGIVYCGGTPCACANGVDDDGDGLSDGFDPECTGPFDQDESSFATGLPGTRRTTKCEDCYFDENAGSGDDQCRHPSSCSLDGTAGSAAGSCGECAPSAVCINACLPRTPSGCDCFGCCEIRTQGTVINVLLDDACSLELLGDVKRCARCVPEPTCKNACGDCELCPGKTIDMLPQRCAANPEGYTCDTADVCSPTKPCGDLAYCQQGCCVPIVL
jgi:hypothetical protein